MHTRAAKKGVLRANHPPCTIGSTSQGSEHLHPSNNGLVTSKIHLVPTQKGLSRSPVTSSWERRLHGSMLYHQPPAQCLSKYRPKAEKTPKKDANPELVQTPCTCRILTPTCCACFRSLSRPDPPHTNFVNGQRQKRYMPSLCSPPEVMGERHASFEGRK